MKTIVSNIPSSPDSTGRLSHHSFEIRPLIILLAIAISSPVSYCQSQPSSQPSQSQPSQSQPQPKDDSNTDAAKKPDKDKPKPKKVYTEADLSNLRGGVSVVGDSNSTAPNSNGAQQGGSKSGNGTGGTKIVPMSGQDEKYWRGRAKEILDQIAAIDQEIAKTNDDIKKYGADGFDAASKLGVIYIDNRASKVQQLEKRKSDLEKKLDQLQEDARKAGAASEWVR